MKLLMLAQNPKTQKNVHSPLEGTRSGLVANAWLSAMRVDRSDVVLANASQKLGKVCRKDYDIAGVSAEVARCDRYVALGEYASGLLELMGVRHFKLPHPSGLSRKTNDREDLRHMLGLCRVYLEGSKT